MSIINPPSWLQAGTYNARADRLGIGSALSAGGVVSATSYAVTQTLTPSTSVQVSAGAAYVANTYSTAQGFYAVVNDGPVTIALDASHANFNRTDLIILTVKDSQYGGATDEALIDKVTGDPGPGANPPPGVLPPNSIILASILVPASSSSIVASNISYSLRQYARFQASMVNAVQAVNSTNLPSGPSNGQLILEENTGKLRANINGTWTTLSPLTAYNVTGGARPAGAESGMIVFEKDTKRFFAFDGSKWNYAGGGGGEIVARTFPSANVAYKPVAGATAPFAPLTLWRDAEGRYNLEGMYTNAIAINGWTINQLYNLFRLPPGTYPTGDIRVATQVVVPGQFHSPAQIVIKGSNPASATAGSIGSVFWQPNDQRTGFPAVQSGAFQIIVPRISWTI